MFLVSQSWDKLYPEDTENSNSTATQCSYYFIAYGNAYPIPETTARRGKGSMPERLREGYCSAGSYSRSQSAGSERR